DKNSPLFDWPYSSIAFDKNGTLWAGNFMTGLYSFNGSTWEKYSEYNTDLLDDDINDLMFDANNNLWIATDKGISVYDGTKFTTYDTNNTTMNGEAVYALGMDKQNNISASTSNGSSSISGISVFDGNDWSNLSGFPSQIEKGKFSEIVFASNNDVWIASDPGITKYSNTTFDFYPRAYTGLWRSASIAIDANENIWAVGYDGILKYDGTIWNTVESKTLGLQSNISYNKIFAEGDYLWLATSAGLLKYNTLTQKIEETFNSSNSPLESNSIIDIKKDAKGNMWLATGSGIAMMHFGGTAVKPATYLSNRISVYPTPSQGILNLNISDLKGDLNIEVTDLTGRKLFSENLNSGNQVHSFNLSAFAKGMYLLNI
ncbi:MAG: T9SS type A sorting domain-containing protein, partial [Sphingobacteriales bacterium]